MHLGKIIGLAHGVDPRRGSKTVVVSDTTGEVIKLEARHENKDLADPET